MESKNYWNNPNEEGVPKPQVIIVGEQNPEKNKKSNNLSATSLALGILSSLLFWGFFWPIVVAAVGLICGIISIVQHREGEKMATAGMIMSVIGLILSLIVNFLLIIGLLFI